LIRSQLNYFYLKLMTSRSSVGPLNVGNVVTTAFSLYKSNFASLMKLSGISVLWSFVPVYGWAKSAMYYGVMSRLGFGLLSNQPETSVEARLAIQERLWTFLITRILMGLVVGAITFGLIIAFAILVGISVALGAALGLVGSVIGVILGLLAFLGLLLGLAWASSRFMVSEVPIAVEENTIDPVAALGRSWNLTQGFVVRLMTIVFVAGLVLMPVQLLTNVGPQMLQYAPMDGVEPVVIGIVFLVVVLLAIAGQILTMPFWQMLIAVVYYDLRARKEGMDIQLRDRPI
jgi:hypothetical protein